MKLFGFIILEILFSIYFTQSTVYGEQTNTFGVKFILKKDKRKSKRLQI
jgi:hypothetical protein